MKHKVSTLLIQRQQLRRALSLCLQALTDETGNVARREYDATIEARQVLEATKNAGMSVNAYCLQLPDTTK